MIDKSIRQYYQEGNKVNIIQEGIKKFVPTTDQGKLDVGQIAKNVATNKLTTAATKKLAGTGILSSLGPIGAIIAYMLARKGINYAKGKVPKDIGQAFTQGFTGLGVGSPQEGRELRQLEKRRANMLQRKEEGKSYSDKNLGIVTRAIAEAKGIDINNPNEMKNIDKDISRLYSKTIYADPSVDSEENQFDNQIITTPKKVSPISYEDDFATTTIEDIINKKVSPISYEDDFATTTIKDLVVPTVSNPNEDRAREEAAATQAAAEKAEIDRQERNAAAEAAAAARAAAARAAAARASPARPHGNGGGNNGGSQGSSRSDSGGGIGGLGGHGPSRWAEGGRIDKPFTGRSRDI